MTWDDLRREHPDQWLVLEAVTARTVAGRRVLDSVAVIALSPDGASAFRRYRELYRVEPHRELYYVHTGRAELEIYEEHWVGIRRAHVAPTAR